MQFSRNYRASSAIIAVLVLVVATSHASAFNTLHSFEFNTTGNAEGWTPTNATIRNRVYELRARYPHG